MAQPYQQTHSNTGCCFTIKHSDTRQHLKEGTLLIATAVATITIIGGVLGVLALNGVNLGALNSIAMAGEKYIYLGLAAGTGLLLIDTALIASLTRSYYNKQYTQKEIDRMGLQDWLESEDVLAKLEPGHYWPLPEKAKQAVPATQTNPGRPAVWGYIVKDFEGNAGIYAFKTEEDAFAQINKLGYENGVAAFKNPLEYTRGYFTTQIDEEALQDLQEFDRSPLNRGEYRKTPIVMEDGTKVFCLRFNKNGSSETHFYKSKEARDQARVGLIKRKDIEKIAAENTEAVEYLPEGSAWILDFDITVNKFAIKEDEKEEVQLYLVYTRKIGTDEIGYSYFPSKEAAKAFIQNNRFQDAKAAFQDPKKFPRQLIEENCNLAAMDISLGAGRFACINLDTKAVGTVFALKIKVDYSNFSHIYFKTEAAREEHIQKHLANYTDIELIYSARDQIKVYSLRSVFAVVEQDCFTYEVTLRNKTHYALITLTNAGIQTNFFASDKARTDFLGDTWVPVNERFTALGEFSSDWVIWNFAAAALEKPQEAAKQLKCNEHDYGRFTEANSRTDVYWIAHRDLGKSKIRYFTSKGLDRVLKGLDEKASKSLPAERAFMSDCGKTAEKIKQDYLLDLALSNEGDCWPIEEIISERRVNILYTRTAEGIEISYPENLKDAIEKFKDVHARIKDTGEYPPALGAHLTKVSGAVSDEELAKREATMLTNEFVAWEGKPTRYLTYAQVHPLQIKDHEGNHTVHYFTTRKAQLLASEGLNNGYVRDRDIQETAKILSQAVIKASGGLAVGHFYTVPYEGNEVAAIVSVTSAGKTSVNYVPIAEVEKAQKETDLTNVTKAALDAKLTNNEIYKGLDPIEKSTQMDYLGKKFDGTGKLSPKEYIMVSRPGYTLLMWLTEEEKPAKRHFFLTDDQALDYAKDNLKDFKEYKEV